MPAKNNHLCVAYGCINTKSKVPDKTFHKWVHYLLHDSLKTVVTVLVFVVVLLVTILAETARVRISRSLIESFSLWPSMSESVTKFDLLIPMHY